MNDCDDFESSALGTKEHWDDQYHTELKNFSEIGDIGEVWFGEASVERVSRWIERHRLPLDSAILDLGCGNGASLLSLHERGFRNLTGVDYSEAAVELAKRIAQKENCEIIYQVADLLSDCVRDCPALSRQYDICLDKGTYDAISLNPEEAASKRAAYRQIVCDLTRVGGLFIITSCNWTGEELQQFFTQQGFELHSVIPTPKIQFGGVEGSSTSVIVFKRVDP